MSWKTNPILLAEQLVKRISTEGETTFDKLEARALSLGIKMSVFDQAIALLHKMKTIKRVTSLGTVRYSIQVVKPIPGPMAHVTWCNENYPWPGKNGIPEFVMPFPEIDLSWIFLKPEQIAEYKAAAKGRGFIPKNFFNKKKNANTRTES